MVTASPLLTTRTQINTQTDKQTSKQKDDKQTADKEPKTYNVTNIKLSYKT